MSDNDFSDSIVGGPGFPKKSPSTYGPIEDVPARCPPLAHVDSLECWCCPQRMTVCEECVVENIANMEPKKREATLTGMLVAGTPNFERVKSFATPGCWKCSGEGWYETDDEEVSIIIHR